MLYLAYRWFWSGLDWLFPPNCAGCDVPGTRWCKKCHQTVEKVVPPYCVLCGQPLLRGDICDRCQLTPLNLTAVRSWALHNGPVRNALHQLKYAKNIALGDTFSDFMADLLIDLNWKIDILTPVPLGAARKKTRGYNQAALLAKPIALKLKIRYKPDMISRTRETLSQVNLNREQRKRNVAGAFRARVNFTRGKNILIIDDVATSLSTLDSCADALLRAGAKKVYGLTLARAG